MDEQGPAHKKNFYVKLQIGEKEEYSASGPSIKKAQHAAASIALEKTEFKHPPPKVPRNYMNPDMMQSEVLEGEAWMMDDLRFYVFFNSISAISGQWADDNERLCAMVPCLRLKRSSPLAGLELTTARSVG